MTVPTVDLRLAEAIELGCALVQELADVRGIRVLFIKGPTLHLQGLRAERPSADVDVLVDPAGVDELVAALTDRGWHRRPSTFLDARRPTHSITLVHDAWPCDLDVHTHYPGFLADPSAVFDTLWQRRAPVAFAHRACAVPDRVGNALILGLHSLRGNPSHARPADELDQLAAASFTDDERLEAAALARATGSVVTLAPVLTRMGVTAVPSPSEAVAPGVTEWRGRLEAGSQPAYFWLLVLRRSGRRERAVIIGRAIWPTRSDLLLAHPEGRDTVVGRTRLRAARWGRGLRALPSFVGAAVRSRRSPRTDP
ncbi:nucleotidyltransferase family protein [Microbacterium sp. P03]|uniref:nucleotidyltransferase family protein n=1 Tax=Microbacterium sp. P03 TaxID=3366946 RepID=UPI003744E068